MNPILKHCYHLQHFRALSKSVQSKDLHPNRSFATDTAAAPLFSTTVHSPSTEEPKRLSERNIIKNLGPDSWPRLDNILSPIAKIGAGLFTFGTIVFLAGRETLTKDDLNKQGINLEAKMDKQKVELEVRMDKLEVRIDKLEAKLETKMDKLEAKLEAKIDKSKDDIINAVRLIVENDSLRKERKGWLS